MKKCLFCLVALTLAACRPPGSQTDDSDAPSAPAPERSSARTPATPVPTPKPGDWMWQTPKLKKKDDLGIKSDALDQKPKK
jgi:hypothetical protein